MRRLALCIALVLSAACQREPLWYPIPRQHTPPPGKDPDLLGQYMLAGDTVSDVYVVQGLGDPQTGWRWSGERIEMRFRLRNPNPKTFQMRFDVNQVTFKDTGPITITFVINGHVLDKVRYDQPGDKEFKKPVPTEWLDYEAENTFVAEIDKPWASPTDGVKLGIIFKEAGFLD